MSNVHLLTTVIAVAAAVPAQDPRLHWPGEVAPQTIVNAMALHDPDGDGPRAVEVAVGGLGFVNDSPLLDGIAHYDLSSGSWRPLGRGIEGRVRCIVAAANGDLFVGGRIEAAGGVETGGIARWDGERWHRLATGIHTEESFSFAAVQVMAPLADGSLAVAGSFTTAGSVPVSSIARWHRDEWHDVGRGVDGSWPVVMALLPLPDRDLVVGGTFRFAGGGYADNLARWDGERWSAFHRGIDGEVRSLLLLPGGDMLAAGAFEAVDGVEGHHVARWDGKGWRVVGAETGPVNCLLRQPDGEILAGGPHGVRRWDGTAWYEFGELQASVITLLRAKDGTVFAGGQGLHCFRDDSWVALLESGR